MESDPFLRIAPIYITTILSYDRIWSHQQWHYHPGRTKKEPLVKAVLSSAQSAQPDENKPYSSHESILAARNYSTRMNFTAQQFRMIVKEFYHLLFCLYSLSAFYLHVLIRYVLLSFLKLTEIKRSGISSVINPLLKTFEYFSIISSGREPKSTPLRSTTTKVHTKIS